MKKLGLGISFAAAAVALTACAGSRVVPNDSAGGAAVDATVPLTSPAGELSTEEAGALALESAALVAAAAEVVIVPTGGEQACWREMVSWSRIARTVCPTPLSESAREVMALQKEFELREWNEQGLLTGLEGTEPLPEGMEALSH
jgi:hypothetical protein